jgi:pilus assembly protein Flp/PilA
MPLQLYVRVSVFLFGLRRLAGDRRGVTALEYGLLAAVMGSLVVTAFTTLGNSMHTAFTSIGGVMTTKASSM